MHSKTILGLMAASAIWALGGPAARGTALYTGGDGASYAMDALTDAFHLGGPMVTLSSAADQSFARGYAAEAAGALTITDGTNYPGISNGMSIAVWIPASFAMTWDEGDVTPVLAGTAASKVNATVSYAGGNQRLLIAATSSFAKGDTLVVSGLAFKNFLGSGSTCLELDYDNDGVADALDDKAITIQGVFAGGDGANYCLHQTLLEKCLHPVGSLISIARCGF